MPVTEEFTQGPASTLDQLGRPVRDLRISVTDRCNFRCRYCMPREQVDKSSFLSRDGIMSFESIARVAGAFSRAGVQKIRLTGGEPLLRRELPKLVEMLAKLDVDLALTTNGVRLPEMAKSLKSAGLNRVTVSLDSLDEEVFQRVCDAPAFSVEHVLRGIDAAEAAGLSPVKINCVVEKGKNDDQIEIIARHFSRTPHIVRFIEFMDVGTRNGWARDAVISAAEIQARLSKLDELEALPAREKGEVARRYRMKAGGGEVGMIASVTKPFCADCTRARLSADGRLYSCLFAENGLDLKSSLSEGITEPELDSIIRGWWAARTDRYSELRSSESDGSEVSDGKRLPVLSGASSSRVEMSYIGG